jgi:hypothetical protein
MDLKLGDNQFTTVHLDGLEPLREEGLFQSPPKWVCSDNTIVKITPDEDGCCCRIEAARPVLHGTATVTVTDRDDSAVPAVIFTITITKDKTTNFGVTIDPATEIGQQPPERTFRSAPPASEQKQDQPPLPKGAVQKDPDTGVVNKNPDTGTFDGGTSFGAPEQPQP